MYFSSKTTFCIPLILKSNDERVPSLAEPEDGAVNRSGNSGESDRYSATSRTLECRSSYRLWKLNRIYLLQTSLISLPFVCDSCFSTAAKIFAQCWKLTQLTVFTAGSGQCRLAVPRRFRILILANGRNKCGGTLMRAPSFWGVRWKPTSRDLSHPPVES